MIVAASCALLLTGCATTTYPSEAIDPYQNYNRAVYNFNDGFYRYVATPVNTVYTTALPQFARTGITNFFDNAATVPAILNDALQWNWRYFAKDTTRFVLNTTLGLFGLIDVAGEAGIEGHEQGFSYTLAKWGWSNSNYFILPFLGPGTVSTAVSLPVNYFTSPLTYMPSSSATSWALWGTNSVQTISNQLPSYNTVNATAVDPYVAIRNAYLQNRAYIIQQIDYDGVTPAATGDNSQVSPILLEMTNS